MPKKQNKESFTRSMQFDAVDRKIDEDKREVSLPFSSEYPVRRYDGEEVLVHEKNSIDFSRMNNGAAVLVEHGGDQIGVVERAWLGDDKRGWVTIRFSRSARGEEVWQDVLDNIRRNVSFGYRQIEVISEPKKDQYRVTKWLPYEVSIVAVPADPEVGIGRSLGDTDDNGDNAGDASKTENIPEKKVRSIMTPEEIKAQEEKIRAEVEAQVRAEAKAEEQRVSEIRSIGDQFQARELANKAIGEKQTVDQFRAAVLNSIKSNPVRSSAPAIVTSEKNRGYSLGRALLAQVPGHNVDCGYEREVSQELARSMGRAPAGIFVDADRAFNKTTGTGSNLIATDLLAGSFIDLLRNKTVVMAAGATVLGGLVGNVAIPKKTAGVTGYWINPESGDVTASNPTIGQVTMSPKHVGAATEITRDLLIQSTPAAESLVMNDIVEQLAVAIDLAGLKGTAANNQPRGITQQSGIGTGNWATANTPSWAKLVEMETKVDTGNALTGSLSYVMGAGLIGQCKTLTKANNQNGFLMEGGQVNGYTVHNTNQLAAGEAIFGNFSDLLIGMWSGLDIVVNPYALDLRGGLRISAIQTMDVAVRHAVSFSFYSNPSGS